MRYGKKTTCLSRIYRRILVIVLFRRNNRGTLPHMVTPPTRSPPNPRRLTNLQMDFQSLGLSFFARNCFSETHQYILFLNLFCLATENYKNCYLKNYLYVYHL